MNKEGFKGVEEILDTEYMRGVHPLTQQAISRKLLTHKLRELGRALEKYNPQKKEEDSTTMSTSFERKICRECNGHGEVEDGKPCPKCGGTGLAEHKDDRIHPRGKEVPKSPGVLE